MTYQRPFPGVATEGSRECFWELVADIKNGYGLGGKAERVHIRSGLVPRECGQVVVIKCRNTSENCLAESRSGTATWQWWCFQVESASRHGADTRIGTGEKVPRKEENGIQLSLQGNEVGWGKRYAQEAAAGLQMRLRVTSKITNQCKALAILMELSGSPAMWDLWAAVTAVQMVFSADKANVRNLEVA